MPHQDVPSDFAGQVNLLKTIKAKVVLDGTASVLKDFLVEQSIDLAVDTALGVTASGHYATSLIRAMDSYKFNQQRDALLPTISSNLSRSAQHLKSFYGAMFKTLGDWHITISDTGKITIPTDATSLIATFTLFKAKNESYILPLVSPLAQFLVLHHIDFSADATNGAAALVLQVDAETAKTDSETEHQKMEIAWAPALANIYKIIAFLRSLYIGKEKELCAYGIVSVASARVDKIKNIKLAIGDTKSGIRTKVGSLLVNTGTETINIYKGKVATGTPIVLLAGQKKLAPKGYSTITVQNASNINSAKLQIIPKNMQ